MTSSGSFLRHRPFAAVGIITGITSCPAAARIIGDHVINKIFITGVTELVRFAGLKEKRIARSDFSYLHLYRATLPRPETTR